MAGGAHGGEDGVGLPSYVLLTKHVQIKSIFLFCGNSCSCLVDYEDDGQDEECYAGKDPEYPEEEKTMRTNKNGHPIPRPPSTCSRF